MLGLGCWKVCGGDGIARPGMFLFTDKETLKAHQDNILAAPFLSGAGKEVRL